MVLDHCVSISKVINLDSFLILLKLTAKWIIDLNARVETVKLVEENMRVNIHVLGLGKAFLEDTKSTSGKGKNR